MYLSKTASVDYQIGQTIHPSMILHISVFAHFNRLSFLVKHFNNDMTFLFKYLTFFIIPDTNFGYYFTYIIYALQKLQFFNYRCIALHT